MFGRKGDRSIARWDIGAPTDWQALPLASLHGDDADQTRLELREVAEELAEGADAIDRLEHFLVHGHAALTEPRC